MSSLLLDRFPIEQLRQNNIAADEVLPLLTQYQLIPQLIAESIVDQAIAPIVCTLEETQQACQLLYQQWGLTSDPQQQDWRSHYSLTQLQFEQLATRDIRLEKFKELTWGHKLKSYFLAHKHNFDQVVYSLLRNRDRDVINELYFRIWEGEQPFAELAAAYSQGAESETGGKLGPFAFGSLRPELARLLYNVPVGEVQPPQQLGDWYAIVRVEQRLPAQLDDAMRHRLLQQQFDQWFQTQVRQLAEWDQRWMGVTLPSTEQ